MSGTLYTPPNANLANVNLNSIGSNYATQFGHQNSLLIQKQVRKAIFDAAPAQFFDLMLLNMKGSEQVDSDEFFYQEAGYGRNPIQANAVSVAATHPATTAVTIASAEDVSLDTVVAFPNNAKGTVTAIVGNVITITPMTGGTVPALAVGELLSNHGPVEADAARDIKQYFRLTTIERHNYVQMFVKARRYGKMELFKHQQAGTTSNYLQLDRMRMLQQFRIDLSNAFWNGERGEVTLSNGTKAKTCGGVYPLMLAAGSMQVSTPVATLPDAIEDAALSTEFGDYGQTRFLCGTPRRILDVSKAYKSSLTRYTPNDKIADLSIDMIKIGSSNIVLVPMKRFEDTASFPANWKDKLFLLDYNCIQPVHCFTEEMGDTLDRSRGSLNNYTDSWVSATFSMKFNNPLACAIINVV
jgi:hypothetical protein